MTSATLSTLAQYAAVMFLLTLFGTAVASAFILCRWRFNARSTTVEVPAISVIKPLCGAPDWLEEALRSWFTLNMESSVQIIFIASDGDDPAWEVVDKLSNEFAGAEVCRVVAGPAPPDWLLKTWNLQSGVDVARYEHLLLADADTLVNASIVHDMIVRLQPSLSMRTQSPGAVYAHPVVSRAKGIGGHFDATVTNFSAMLVQPLLNVCRIDELASFCLLHRSTLDRVGGFHSIGRHIADDISLGRLLKNAGYTLSMCPYPINVISEHMNLYDYFRHQGRWLVTWRVSAGVSAGLAFMYSSTGLALVGLLLSIRDWHAWATVFGIVMAEMMLMFFIEIRLNLRTPKLWHIVSIPFVLLAQQSVAIASLCTNRVFWAGTWYQVNGRGLILHRWRRCAIQRKLNT